MPQPRPSRFSVLPLILATIMLVTGRAEDMPALPGDAPTNLQVLPKDLAPRSLDRVMKRYGQDLGVKCSYCHVENRETGKLDYASDENPKKHTARVMIAMLEEINDNHLARLGADARYAAGVTCGSCHRGRANPQAFEGKSP